MIETLYGLDLAHYHFFVTFEQVLAHDLDSNIPWTACLIACGCSDHSKGALA